MLNSDNKTTVSVFCASSAGNDAIHEQKSFELGEQLASNGNYIYFGGGQSGNMGALMRGALQNNGSLTALIPEVYYNEEETFHQNIKIIPCENDTDRLSKFMAQDFKIVASGGFGSMGEMGVAMTRVVDSTYGNNPVTPLIFYNIDGHWDPIKQLAENIVQNGFGKKEAQGLFKFTDNAKEVVQIIKSGAVNIKRLSNV